MTDKTGNATGMTAAETRAPEELSAAEAEAELARLAALIGAANIAYHQQDAPEISDAAYDRLKQ